MSSIEAIFNKVFPVVNQYSGMTRGRHLATTTAVIHVLENDIHGDFVECGVFRGASVMNMALTLLQSGHADRNIYLYDTFEGMPATTEEDGPDAEQYVEQFRAGQVHGCQCDEDAVRNNILSTGYPQEKFIFVPGKVEDTLPNALHQQIAILRLDTDWYTSSLHEMEHLFPLLATGGVLLLDDYWYWPGQKKATDEYFAKNNLDISRLIRTDGGAYYVRQGG